MYGEVTSRNHQAYSWGHLGHNNTSQSTRFALVIEHVSSIHPWANTVDAELTKQSVRFALVLL